MRNRNPAILALAAALALARPGLAAQTADGEEPVGPGYRMQYFDGSLKKDPARIFVIVRVMAHDGMLRACGVAVADMSDAVFTQLGSGLTDMNSTLRFGAPETRGVRLRPSFLAVRRAIVLDGLDGKPRLPKDLQANCVTTDAAWEDRFGSEPFALELYQTRFKSMLRQWR